jgi:hypothetical protein
MARMNPIDPRLALRDGLYVPPPGQCTAEMIARSMELEPTSTHLVVGGIGSGKTSELIMATMNLRASLAGEGDHTDYIDISRRHDLAAPRLSGVLLALIGEALAKRVPDKERGKDIQAAIDGIERHAHGFVRFEPADEPPGLDLGDWDEPGRRVRVPGVLVPPTGSGAGLAEVGGALQVVRTKYPGDDKHACFLIDSLDRLQNATRFREAVQDDLKELKRARIGLVLVGPARFMSGTDRSVIDLFDNVHFRLAADPLAPEGAEFLGKVLRTRADRNILPDESIAPLIETSGGVLRDLISLAKRAGEEAYAAGRARIERTDVRKAAEAFGRTLVVGLDKAESEVLKRVLDGKAFSISGELELSLIETRRILLYEDNVWRVHPALKPILVK